MANKGGRYKVKKDQLSMILLLVTKIKVRANRIENAIGDVQKKLTEISRIILNVDQTIKR